MLYSLYKNFKCIRNRLLTLAVKSGFSNFGTHSTISHPFRSGKESRISIGSRVFIGPNSWIEVMSKDAGLDVDPVISIGNGVAISGDCTITAIKSVIIEENVLIARFVHISDHYHATDRLDLPIKEQGETKILPVRIGEGSWIGHGSVICPGVTIGRNAVVGANSVVRDDVPSACVVAGAPARIVRMISENQAEQK